MTTNAELEDALRERDRRIAELKVENDKKAELEEALRESDRRLAELKAENDRQADLIRRQRKTQTARLLEIIQANPGLTAVEVHRALTKRSWAAQRFGKWAAMFGPTYGAMYVALAQLARDGSVNVTRGETTAGGRRPLCFYARRTQATEPL